ncbi:MAG: TRAP transporter small permease [Rhodospirillales bacterium]|nr:TRAP transporter small permease [Rhodospirillales bacterium]
MAITNMLVGFAKWSAITAVVIMTVMVFLQVIFRYVLGEALSFSEELARYMFVWSVAMGTALALRRHSHIGVEVFVERLPARFHDPAKIVGSLLNLTFFGLLIWYGFVMVGMTMDQESAALLLPMGYVYLAIPISGIVLFVCEIANFLESYRATDVGVEPAVRE